ncbi:MAG: ribosome biogenesis/translation initiation ATPase RLI [Nanoarchaeota archaeon]|nr:ribosome biogenesis/translation initiation ATPase RLI [Nanoarchaeota archaeon]
MRKVAVVVDREKCAPLKCSHECIKYDPLNRSGKEGFKIGPHGKAEIDELLAQDFHSICAKVCPFQAIKLVRLPERLDEEPLHRYGQNQFELFRLPIPKKNTVVGILGRNGIGKSTAFEILSGKLKPNLGKFSAPPNDEQIIESFASIPLREYFSSLFAKKLRISYKPQRVDLIPKFFSGSVHTLMQKVDETGQSKELLQELNADHLGDKDISKLSGGELQKVAIVAACVKNADFYFFDEPASFLDITARMAAVRVMKSIRNAAVLVAEHDLTTLDYISDEIQMVYGEPAAYGVFSQSKAVKRGINEYLDGYLPDENVRFRNYSIVFSKPVFRGMHQQTLFSFPELKKQFPGFHLTVHPGDIRKGEVLAVMGPNGLGKSTFLNMLAGVYAPDVGVVPKVKLSYKPQYIQQKDVHVEEYLRQKAGSLFETGWYKAMILEKLGVERVLKNTMNTLSGGELQKVYIAGCLSEDADVFALDEPSAFIDVEDRLKVAEVIKEFTQKKEVAAIVVDHDIQFIDYLADAMLVFDGVPGRDGHVIGPCAKEEGMNAVLKMLDITYRLDKDTKRPRINKPDSQLDKEQKEKNKFYYS